MKIGCTAPRGLRCAAQPAVQQRAAAGVVGVTAAATAAPRVLLRRGAARGHSSSAAAASWPSRRSSSAVAAAAATGALASAQQDGSEALSSSTTAPPSPPTPPGPAADAAVAAAADALAAPLTPAEAALDEALLARGHAALCAEAAALRDSRAAPHRVRRLLTFSPKVFIPLTRLCRDACGYCTFARPPVAGRRAYMTLDEVVAVAKLGAAQGCSEALFTLGER